MNAQFAWNEKYSVGDSEIDNQHKSLFELGNRISNSASTHDIKPDVMRLFKYTREHFKAEEAMMKRIGFPLAAEHAKLHDDLITKLSDVTSIPLDTDDNIDAFKKFIFEWLIDHIMNEDNKYFRFSRTLK